MYRDFVKDIEIAKRLHWHLLKQQGSPIARFSNRRSKKQQQWRLRKGCLEGSERLAPIALRETNWRIQWRPQPRSTIPERARAASSSNETSVASLRLDRWYHKACRPYLSKRQPLLCVFSIAINIIRHPAQSAHIDAIFHINSSQSMLFPSVSV
jgi:hypothetical protein